MRKTLHFFEDLAGYAAMRVRQLLVLSGTFTQSLILGLSNLKASMVRNMYWGRTSFYKTFFHVLVLVTTLVALYSGLDSKIASVQRMNVKTINVSEGYQVDSDVVSQQSSFFPQLVEDSDSIYIEYTVAAGDSLEKISKQWGIKQDTLRWANGIPAGRDTLAVGQVIKIPKVDGVLYTVRQGDTVDSVLAKVQLKDKDADKLTFIELNRDAISGGNLIVGKAVILYDATIPTPVTNNRRQQLPQSTPLNIPSGVFVNPLQLCSYSYSRGYKRTHTGVDLGVNKGCWVVAAGSGIVTRAGYCGDLGTCVVIKHANGLSTVYGHGNGVLAVRTGQQVLAGQRIMQSGCSGNCDGPHLHFSLAANNQDVLNCYYCRINPRGIIPY
jgi:murein DD-endopeptidase MepM/ murein hydrolase activator NlpD